MNKPLNKTHTLQRTALVLATLAALAACSTVPARNASLDLARNRFDAAQGQSQVVALAPDELKRASEALRVAEQAQSQGANLATVDHLAYLASQRVTIAQDTAASRAAQAVTAGASAERDRMRLAMRTQEANAAQRQLASAERTQVRSAQELAAYEQALASSERSNANKAAELAQAAAAAQADRDRLARRDAQVDDLQSQLAELNARKTERGIVVTLGDMLFDTGRAELKGDGNRTMAKLADFLSRNPQRRAVIEGYTDSVGTAAFNQDLSDRRARTVKNALQNLGVAADRLSTQAYGEDSPVADNATAAGRQQNRRVEVVFAPAAGDVLLK